MSRWKPCKCRCRTQSEIHHYSVKRKLSRQITTKACQVFFQKSVSQVTRSTALMALLNPSLISLNTLVARYWWWQQKSTNNDRAINYDRKFPTKTRFSTLQILIELNYGLLRSVYFCLVENDLFWLQWMALFLNLIYLHR